MSGKNEPVPGLIRDVMRKPASRVVTREELLAMQPEPMQLNERDALERLLSVANRDTGQSRKLANFLLAWWNAEECGGFDLTDLWGLDTSLRNDAVVVFGLVARLQHYPDSLGYRAQFDQLVTNWRAHLVSGAGE